MSELLLYRVKREAHVLDGPDTLRSYGPHYIKSRMEEGWEWSVYKEESALMMKQTARAIVKELKATDADGIWAYAIQRHIIS